MLRKFLGSSKFIDYFIYAAITMVLWYIVLRIVNIQIIGDDWMYSASYDLTPLFHFGRAWHPGRHISEMINIVSIQILGSQLLGTAINNPLLGARIASSVSALMVFIFFWSISLVYIDIKNRSLQTVSLLIIMILSLFLDASSYFTHILMITGGFVFALIAWTPFLYFYRFQLLPQWMIGDVYKTYGIMIVLFYLGTQVVDTSYMVMCSLSVMLLIFLYLSKYLPKFFENINIDKNEFCLLRNLLILHMFFGLYALIRNTIFSADQVSFRVTRMSLELFELYQRFIGQAFFQRITLIGSFIYIVWVLFSLKNIMTHKISLKKYFYFSTVVVGFLFSCVFIILGTYIDQPIWIIWLTLLSITVNLYQNNQKYVKILLPTLVLCLFVDCFRLSVYNQSELERKSERRIDIFVQYFIPVSAEKKENVKNLLRKFIIPTSSKERAKFQRLYGVDSGYEIENLNSRPNFDFQMAEYFKKAELENKDVVVIPVQEPLLNHHTWPYLHVSEWMQKYRYTTDRKNIEFVEEKQAP